VLSTRFTLFFALDDVKKSYIVLRRAHRMFRVVGLPYLKTPGLDKDALREAQSALIGLLSSLCSLPCLAGWIDSLDYVAISWTWDLKQ
jgi:hypothetical protein